MKEMSDKTYITHSITSTLSHDINFFKPFTYVQHLLLLCQTRVIYRKDHNVFFKAMQVSTKFKGSGVTGIAVIDWVHKSKILLFK